VVKTGSEAAREWREGEGFFAAVFKRRNGQLIDDWDGDSILAAYAREEKLRVLREAAKRTCSGCELNVSFDGEVHRDAEGHIWSLCEARAIHQIIGEIEAEEQP
jgi:hypothetical protein